MKKNEDHLEKIDSALNDSVKDQKAQEKGDEKCIKQAIDLVWRFFLLVFFLGMLLLPFGPWLYNLLPSQVLKKESIAYYDSLRVAKVDSTVEHKEDSIFTLYNPKDTLIFWGEIDENELIQQLTTLTFRDTIYLQVGRLPVVYGRGDYIMFNPIKGEMFRIIISTDKYRLNSSFVRFDSIQVMNWPHRPFHLIYFDFLGEESIPTLIKDAEKTWSHLYYDSIQ